MEKKNVWIIKNIEKKKKRFRNKKKRKDAAYFFFFFYKIQFFSKFERKMKKRKMALIKNLVFQNYFFIKNLRIKFIGKYFCKQ